jgi:cathepsin L
MLKMALIAAAAAALIVAAGASVEAARPQWHELKAGYSYERYLADHGKAAPAKAAERAMRRQLFETELAAVLAHNADATQTWKRGVNKFSDWTESEKRALRGWDFGLHQRVKATGEAKPERVHLRDNRPLPPSVDWRTSVPPILGAVKDQGQCGSCYAHAATEIMETAWAQATGNLFVLSQEQVMSCTWNPNECGGTGGCGGGIAQLCVVSVVDRGGIVENWVAPYTSYLGTNADCKSLTLWHNLTAAKFTGYTQVEENSEEATLHALAFAGPLAISVDASDWSSYESGIFTGCAYSKNISQDHAVVAVGYGTDPATNMAYVIVKNSWSSAWGENGFIRLAQNVPGQPKCGWNVNPQQGSGCKGQTAPQWSCGTCGWAFSTQYANPLI